MWINNCVKWKLFSCRKCYTVLLLTGNGVCGRSDPINSTDCPAGLWLQTHVAQASTVYNFRIVAVRLALKQRNRTATPNISHFHLHGINLLFNFG